MRWGLNQTMVNLSRKNILERFPWAKEKSLYERIEVEQIDDDLIQWNLNEKQLELVFKLFEELEEWFKTRNISIDIKIYYVGELLDRLHIDFSSQTSEVYMIVDKYKRFSLDLLYEVNELEEEENYDDVF